MIGVIADDLSGASEIGAVGLRFGLSAEVITDGNPSGRAALVCVDTDSRACAPEEAAQRVRTAAKLLTQHGAKFIYKKIDSVLRGPVTAEVEAAMQQLGFKRALLVPANPALGRIIKDGNYFVKSRPLNRTEFGRDPEYPRRSAKVLKLLDAPRRFHLDVATLRQPLPPNGIVAGEASLPAHLKKWAAKCPADMLAVGASGFFSALLEERGHERLRAAKAAVPDAAGGRELFVCGTTSESSRHFMSAARARRTPIFSLPRELAWGAEFSTAATEAVSRQVVQSLAEHPRAILSVGLPVVHERTVARRLTVHLAQLASAVLRQVEVARVYAEGGATAAELTRQMGWARMKVVHELAPGVAMLAVAGENSTLLTIKPGTYTWPARIQCA